MKVRIDLMDPSFCANPFPIYEELRRNHPVCQVEPGGFWAVARYDDVMFVLKHHELFSSAGLRHMTQPEWLESRNPATDALGVMDPPLHSRLRPIITRAFSSRVFASLEEQARGMAEALADELRPGGDFIEQFALPLAIFSLCRLLGLPRSLQRRFKAWVDTMMGLTPHRPSAERAAEIHATLAELEGYLRESIETRQRSPTDDLVSTLALADKDEQPLNLKEMTGILAGLMVGGLHTTTYMLALSMVVLTEMPEVLARLRADASLIPRFVEEVLRHQSPLNTTFRVTTQEVGIAGVRLPQGSVVLPLLASANRDEKYFPDANRFDLDRKSRVGLAFGHGIHTCVGNALARLEARVALEVLLSRFSDFQRQSEQLEWSGMLVMRIPLSLPLRAIPAG